MCTRTSKSWVTVGHFHIWCQCVFTSFHFIFLFQCNLQRTLRFVFLLSIHCYCFCSVFVVCVCVCMCVPNCEQLNVFFFLLFCLISHLFTQWNHCCLWWKNFIKKINFIKMPCKIARLELLFHSKEKTEKSEWKLLAKCKKKR